MKVIRIDYENLNAKQKEIYNFQKCAALLANYGFNCIKLSDDWNGADFLAVHIDGTTLRVQLKARLGIWKKYLGRGLHIAFPIGETWCVIEHDELVRIVGETTNWLNSEISWIGKGEFHSLSPSKALCARLSDYVLNGESFALKAAA